MATSTTAGGHEAAAVQASVVVVGVSHHGAPVEVRERLSVPAAGLATVLHWLRDEVALPEAVVLSTCNRFEVYAAADEAAVERLVGALCGRAGRDLGGCLYRMSGEEAARHAFRVASGLDSLVLGEPQVLGQVKDAYQAAADAGTLGPMLGALRHRTFSVAKRARTETGIGRHAISISHVAVELARKIFGRLEGRQVVLVGSGKMCSLAARRLGQEGAAVSVVGRTLERARELAATLGGRALPFAALREAMAGADIVISGTSSPGTVVAREDVERAVAGRGGRPLFLVDIALPRDVDPAVREVAGVFLYDLDDLRAVAEANLCARRREASHAEELVAREARDFEASQRVRGALPLLAELRRRADAIRRQEMEQALRRMGPLSPQQQEAMEAVSAAIVNKLLHAPTVHLRQMAREGDEVPQVMFVRALLGLA
jgi:glutamyl-tRNA reductase